MADIERVVAKIHFTVQFYYTQRNDNVFNPSVSPGFFFLFFFLLFDFCQRNSSETPGQNLIKFYCYDQDHTVYISMCIFTGYSDLIVFENIDRS